MSTSIDAIVDLIKSGNLPSTTPASLLSLYDPVRNIFPEQECAYWDYKAQFPFSLSDDYFGGILRLVCAFYNSFGGLIIFGVKDDTRTPGHNLVKINVERLNNVIRTDLTKPIEVKHREYFLDEGGDLTRKVDVILVPKRPMSVPPVRLSKKVGQEPANRIFMRVGHEVVEPTSIDLPSLYSSRDDYGLASGDGPAPVQNALPPRPATLKEFIGRRDALDRLYSWLFASDDMVKAGGRECLVERGCDVGGAHRGTKPPGHDCSARSRRARSTGSTSPSR
jgi:schlafen family protein